MSIYAGEEGTFTAGSYDSLSAVELSNEIATALNIQLPGTLVFDYPSVASISKHLNTLLNSVKSGNHFPIQYLSTSMMTSRSPCELVEKLVEVMELLPILPYNYQRNTLHVLQS